MQRLRILRRSTEDIAAGIGCVNESKSFLYKKNYTGEDRPTPMANFFIVRAFARFLGTSTSRNLEKVFQALQDI